MNATKSPHKTLPRIPAKKIPAALIYEIMDGKPVYYRGYREVLKNEKTIEEVMGASSLQGIMVEYILRILFRQLDEKQYHILTNEQGLHLNRKNNLSAGIAIYEKTKFSVAQADKHYATIPPKIQIEVDINADTEGGLVETYINKKTDKLFEFGVEKVIWVLSESKKVIVATPNANWQIIDWHKDIEVIDGVIFCIGKYLMEEGSPFA
ncbi:MAG: Uma2 family endonuclease [Haliscomenobacter sp.]|nr:Uma2 family endonuclease [Haliscomenobacter sp.]MBK9489354.1 Uma2 family endonuclease [Haliscomenobacter sp.]